MIASRHLPLRQSIGARIFIAFAITGLITAALGAYGFYMLSMAGKIVVETYDRPLMAINFAGAASLDFAEMDKEALRRKTVPVADRPAVDQEIKHLTATFFEDLEVAKQRSLADDERRLTDEIKSLVVDWGKARHDATDGFVQPELDALSKKITDHFQMLVELTADHSFVERRKAVWSISYFEYASIVASILALLLSAAITFVLARRIIRPLAAAANVANRIADGELQTPIPEGGADETGTLLRSMTVMQDNIRVMMENETAQRKSAQNRLVDALESSREGMLLVDAEGRIVTANSQLASFFPAAAAALSTGGDFMAAFARVLPDVLPVDQESTELCVDEPRSLPLDGEFQLLDGRWIRFSRSTTRDQGFFLFFSDFTEIKEREERFKEAKQQAEAASKAKTNFLANMSHELRTPLNAVIGFSEIISTQLFGPISTPQYVAYAGDILRSGQHLLDIINSVLDLAKSDAGKLQLHPERLDLRMILQDCASMMHEQCTQAQLDLRVAWPIEPLMVLAEPAKLRQIFLNLLSNAVKFTGAGGRIALSARAAAGGRIEVQVTDTGIGMSPEEIPVALAPFGQIDSRLARRYEGTGLGLPLTKVFVELHGGTMMIASERGKGTVVTVALADAASEQVAA